MECVTPMKCNANVTPWKEFDSFPVLQPEVVTTYSKEFRQHSAIWPFLGLVIVKNKLVSVLCVCPLIDDKLHQNIVKVYCGTTRLWLTFSQSFCTKFLSSFLFDIIGLENFLLFLTNHNPELCVICTGVIHFLQWCYTLTALPPANQNWPWSNAATWSNLVNCSLPRSP